MARRAVAQRDWWCDVRHHRLFVLTSVSAIVVAVIGGVAGIAVRAAQAQHRATVTRNAAANNIISSPLCYRWSAYSGPTDGSNNSVLNAVAAVPSSTQLWAVGTDVNGTTTFLNTLIERYNGVWSVVPSLNVASQDNFLTGVVAISSNNAWAVGYTGNASAGSVQTLIEHWNGTSWSIVPSPSVAQTTNFLYAVAAVSASDIWAVGRYFSGSVSLWQTLVEHWNGTSWSIVASPNGSVVGPKTGLPGQNALAGVTAISANDVWAVGNDTNLTLIEHWNGTSWSIVPSPNGASGTGDLTAVAATSATNVVAVGYVPSSGASSTLVEQWNGSRWSVVASPNLGGTNSDGLNAIVAIPGTSQFIAAGTAGAFGAIASGSTTRMGRRGGPYSSIPTTKTLIELWNGTTWNILPTPNLSPYANGLNGIVATSPLHIWAVGSYQPSSIPSQTLIEQYVPNGMLALC